MTERIIIAGTGGQGVMLLGKVLAEAVMRDGKSVTWFPSYGAEVRGGTAYCMVVVSSLPIGSPYIEKADTLIIMNSPSLERFKFRMTNNGLLLINSSLVPQHKNQNERTLEFPFTDMAIKLGNIRVANMVSLGCYIAKKKIVSVKKVLRAIEEIAPADKKNLIEINKEAVLLGVELIK